MKIDVKFFESDQRMEVTLNERELRIDAGFDAYQEVTVLKDAEPYTGSYLITPSVNEQILNTAQKQMTQDMTIKEIPYYATSNPQQGETVYIGSEVDIYGD